MAEEIDFALEGRKISVVGKNNSSDYTAGKPRAPKQHEHAAPHYLRASTGSCHDACKYGKPHEFINKPWKPMSRRVSAPPPNTKKIEEIQIFCDKKVKVALQPDSTSGDGIKKKVPPSRKSPEPNSSKLIKQDARPFRKSPSPEVPKATKKVIQSSEKLSLPDNSKPVRREIASASQRAVSTKRASSTTKERNFIPGPSKSKGLMTVPSSSPDSSIVFGGRKFNKATTVIEPKTTRVSVKKVLPPAAAVLPLQKASKIEVKRNVNVLKTGLSRTNPSVKAGTSNSRKNKSPKNRPKNETVTNQVEIEEPVDEKVEEKTLHMIETRENDLSSAHVGCHFIQSPSPLSPESLNSSQENSQSFTSHEVDDEQELTSDYTDNEADDSVVNSLKEPRTLESGDQGRASMKLNFRRGTIVDPQPETNSPRRLQFRQGRNLGDNQEGNGGPRRRSYRRKASDDNKKEPETGQAKVVLKHQEVEEKKDMQVLLNNVIEETASKLVETRKSKVKALVGAFETVISLQESKQSPPHASNAAANR